MVETVWTLPVPSTALSYEPDIRQLLGRTCCIRCGYGIRDNKAVRIDLFFDGVESFRCTYHNSCTYDMREAYDEIVDRGSSEWLEEVKRQLLTKPPEDITGLRHLMIYFDDGPCYEFICRGFRVEETIVPETEMERRES